MGQETATKVADAPQQQYVTLDLPEGMTVEDFREEPEAASAGSPSPSGESTPASTAPPTTTEKPEKPVAAEKPAEPEKKGDVRKALKEERGKHHDTKAERDALREVVGKHNLWDQVESERAKGLANLSRRPEAPAVKVGEPKHAAGPSAEAIERADKADSFGSQAKPVLEDAHRMAKETSADAHRMAQQAAELAVQAIPLYVMRVQEAEQREEHDGSDEKPTYDEVLQKSGVFEALTQGPDGSFRDPVIARIVYGSANPAKKAYRLALDKLAKDKAAAENGTVVPAVVEEEPARVPAKAEPAEVARARQDGARQVAEAVVSSAGRPKGIQVLRDAGQPVRVGLNAAFWDSLKTMMRTEPDKFGRYMEKNPSVDEWYMGGRPAA